MKESKAMMKKEVSFMKKKGAPKSMLKHEMAEMRGEKKMRGGGDGPGAVVMEDTTKKADGSTGGRRRRHTKKTHRRRRSLFGLKY